MRFLLNVSTAALLMLPGCTSSAVDYSTSASTLPVLPRPASTRPAFSVGDTYVVTLKSENESSGVKYTGVVKDADDETITMTNPQVEASSESSIPVLEKIPYVERLFKNTGVAREALVGDLRIRRQNVLSAERVASSPSNVVSEQDVAPERR